MSGELSKSTTFPSETESARPAPAAARRPSSAALARSGDRRAVVDRSRGRGELLPPSPPLFRVAYMFAPMIATALVLAWWLVASRLRRTDRVLVVGLFVAAAAATARVGWQNLTFMGIVLYALPVVLSVWVGWLTSTSRLEWPVRRLGLLVAIVLAWGIFALVRIDGMDGTFNPAFSWRWSPTAEDRMLASLAASPQSAPVETPTDAAATAVPVRTLRSSWPPAIGPAFADRPATTGCRASRSPPIGKLRRRASCGNT